jgi:SAM-dependent methyltransferase
MSRIRSLVAYRFRQRILSALPDGVREAARSWKRLYWQRDAVGRVQFGSLRRLEPLCRDFGYNRGTPIDRVYIDRFLASHAVDIQGRILEVGGDDYSRKYGSAAKLKSSDVLHVTGGNPRATIIADLAHAPHIPDGAFDCIILTQVLHLIFDFRSAVHTLHRILGPGGIVLATFPGISQVSRAEWKESWYWSFTERSAELTFAQCGFGDHVDVEYHGNVLTSIAFLHGLAAEELSEDELNRRDPQYQMLVCVRAVKQK